MDHRLNQTYLEKIEGSTEGPKDWLDPAIDWPIEMTNL